MSGIDTILIPCSQHVISHQFRFQLCWCPHVIFTVFLDVALRKQHKLEDCEVNTIISSVNSSVSHQLAFLQKCPVAHSAWIVFNSSVASEICTLNDDFEASAFLHTVHL